MTDNARVDLPVADKLNNTDLMLGGGEGRSLSLSLLQSQIVCYLQLKLIFKNKINQILVNIKLDSNASDRAHT